MAHASHASYVVPARQRPRQHVRPRVGMLVCYRLVLLALAASLLFALPQHAHAIITPDEAAPPKPATMPAGGAGSTGNAAAAGSAVSGGAGVLPRHVGGDAAPIAATVSSGVGKMAPGGSGASATTAAKTGAVVAAGTEDTDDDNEVAPVGVRIEQEPPAKPQQPIEIHERHVRGVGRSAAGDYFDDDEFEDRELMTSSAFEVEDDGETHAGGGKRQNYASLDAGATILDSSQELKSPTSLLVPDKDRYMLMPCEKPRKWVVVSLSEDVHADAIAVANYEKFSSTVKDFLVLGSVNYPTETWFVLGNFTAAQSNGEQVFPLDSLHHVRYIKLRFFSHYGSEYYCTLSQLKVYGRTFTQVISQLEKSIDAEGVLDSTPMLPASPPTESPDVPTPSSADGGPSDGHDDGPSDQSGLLALVDQCAVIEESTVFDAFWVPVEPVHGPTCMLTEGLVHAKRTAPPRDDAVGRESSSDASIIPSDLELEAAAALAHVGSEQQHAGAAHSPNATTHAAGAGKANVSSSSATAVPAVATSATGAGSTAGLHTQGLGRLESIFVRITKKIQHLELNQSVFARQLEDSQAQQKAVAATLQTKQDALSTQLQEIRSILTDMRTRMDHDAADSDAALRQYKRIVEELRKENAALWHEMLIVREVITTMKAGILCAIVLSVCIIVVYLVRLLFRCITNAKRRADLREWFWRMENANNQLNAQDASAAGVVDDEPVGSWRLNHKKQFGSSWDDHAIERKTLLRELVDNMQTVDGRRSKRMRTASLVFPPALKDFIAQLETTPIKQEPKH